MSNPNAKDNLKPFKPGDERINRKGRPKLPDLSEAMANLLAETKDGKTALDAILMALRAKAAKGDVRAAELLMDRGFGKPKQTMDLNTQNVTLTVIRVEPNNTITEITPSAEPDNIGGEEIQPS